MIFKGIKKTEFSTFFAKNQVNVNFGAQWAIYFGKMDIIYNTNFRFCKMLFLHSTIVQHVFTIDAKINRSLAIEFSNGRYSEVDPFLGRCVVFPGPKCWTRATVKHFLFHAAEF